MAFKIKQSSSFRPSEHESGLGSAHRRQEPRPLRHLAQCFLFPAHGAVPEGGLGTEPHSIRVDEGPVWTQVVTGLYRANESYWSLPKTSIFSGFMGRLDPLLSPGTGHLWRVIGFSLTWASVSLRARPLGPRAAVGFGPTAAMRSVRRKVIDWINLAESMGFLMWFMSFLKQTLLWITCFKYFWGFFSLLHLLIN